MARSRSGLTIGGVRIRAGETRDIRLKASETYTGEVETIPMRVIRAARSGPVLLLTSAVHGDEINGTGAIRELLFGSPPDLRRGSLICVPVINVFGFERHDRYMPDRRDLNRVFPGSRDGSMSSRLAHLIMHELVAKADYLLDFHSAAEHRTNYPNVRGDVNQPEVRRLAKAFGCELIVSGKGPEGSLRNAACAAGCPAIILEAGEPAKIEPAMLEVGLRGIHNVLIELGMIEGEPVPPPFQVIVRKTAWVRASVGGLLRFHVVPGDIVEAGQPLATNESVFGDAHSVLIAPMDGIVLGMATHPAVKPGEPVCHIAAPRRSLQSIRRARDKRAPDAHDRLQRDLATSFIIGGTDHPTSR